MDTIPKSVLRWANVRHRNTIGRSEIPMCSGEPPSLARGGDQSLSQDFRKGDRLCQRQFVGTAPEGTRAVLSCPLRHHPREDNSSLPVT